MTHDKDAQFLHDFLQIGTLLSGIALIVWLLWPAETELDQQNEILKNIEPGNYVMNVDGEEDMARFVIISAKGKIISDQILTSYGSIARDPWTNKIIGGTYYKGDKECFRLVHSSAIILSSIQIPSHDICGINPVKSANNVIWQTV